MLYSILKITKTNTDAQVPHINIFFSKGYINFCI